MTASDRIDDGRSVTPRQSHWMPHIKSPDFAPVKGAVLDPAVLSWIGQSTECFQFRVDTLKWIQGRLEDPKTATSDVTIGAIMTFSMWTVCCFCSLSSVRFWLMIFFVSILSTSRLLIGGRCYCYFATRSSNILLSRSKVLSYFRH